MRLKLSTITTGLLLFSAIAVAQNTPPANSSTEKKGEPAKPENSQSNAAPASSANGSLGTSGATKEEKLVAEEPGTLISEEKLYSGAKIYVAPMLNGFDNYIVAGLQQKKVPVIVVALREKADYEITGIAETDKAGWAKMLFIGSQQTNESASIKMVNLKTGSIVFAYSVNKVNSVRGKQSAGEACAKHIKQKIVE